jgi:hypothetical protein
LNRTEERRVAFDASVNDVSPFAPSGTKLPYAFFTETV